MGSVINFGWGKMCCATWTTPRTAQLLISLNSFALSQCTLIYDIRVADEFIVETVVSSNEMLSDDSTMARPFGESSYSAVVAVKEHSNGGLHNAYVAVGTFATAIVIVVAVVSENTRYIW